MNKITNIVVSYILKIFVSLHCSGQLLSPVDSRFDLRVEFFTALHLSDVPLFSLDFFYSCIFACIKGNTVIFQ